MLDKQEELAQELAGHFRFVRDSLKDHPDSPDSPASLVRDLSDDDIDAVSKIMAPFLMRQMDRRTMPTEADLADLARSILATPGLFKALARVSSDGVHIVVPAFKPPDENRDGALMFYRKACKKLQFEQFSEARSLLKKSIKLCDNYAPAWEALAEALNGCGQHDQSRQAAARAADLRGGSP